MIFWRDILLHAHSRTQVQIGLSSPESEFYGCCVAAAELLYYKGLLSFLGYATKGRLMMDASSAIAIATRSGVGSVRHLAARYLWVQREVENQSFSVEKVAGQRNPADLGTKHVDVATLLFGWWIHGWMVQGMSTLRSCFSFHRARRARRSMSDD